MLTVREWSSMAIRRIQEAGPAPGEAGVHVMVPAKAEPVERTKKALRAIFADLGFMLGGRLGSNGPRGSASLERHASVLQVVVDGRLSIGGLSDAGAVRW